jgi:hypothetical protein
MIPTVVTSKAEMVEAIRRRRDELAVTHETIDAISGMAGGYTSKLLAPEPIKNFGEMSLGSVLGALALGIAAVVIFEDPEQVERVGDRWVKRRRAIDKKKQALLASALSIEQIAREEFRQHMRQLGSKGGKIGGSKGGKRRLKTMGKRRRQHIAAHAARMRWSQARVRGGVLNASEAFFSAANGCVVDIPDLCQPPS